MCLPRPLIKGSSFQYRGGSPHWAIIRSYHLHFIFASLLEIIEYWCEILQQSKHRLQNSCCWKQSFLSFEKKHNNIYFDWFSWFFKSWKVLVFVFVFALFLWEIKNENHWAIMEVWSVRLGLGFGEKKVLIHPIKVYWAPLMEDWRIFIQSNKDLFQQKINIFVKPKSNKYTKIPWATNQPPIPFNLEEFFITHPAQKLNRWTARSRTWGQSVSCMVQKIESEAHPKPPRSETSAPVS